MTASVRREKRPPGPMSNCFTKLGSRLVVVIVSHNVQTSPLQSLQARAVLPLEEQHLSSHLLVSTTQAGLQGGRGGGMGTGRCIQTNDMPTLPSETQVARFFVPGKSGKGERS